MTTTTTTQTAPVVLVCTECGIGNYYRDPFSSHGGFAFTCEECGHAVAWHDVELEEGEVRAMTADGALAYVPAAD